LPGERKSKKDSEQEKRFLKAVSRTFKERAVRFPWSRRNVHEARQEAAQKLADYINKYQFKEGEKLNIVGFSHGGNVGFLLSHLKLKHRIDTLVTLGTPITGYRPEMKKISQLYTAYSAFDRIQQRIGGGYFYAPIVGEFGPASIGIRGYSMPIGIKDEGLIKTHTGLTDASKWNTYIAPRIENQEK